MSASGFSSSGAMIAGTAFGVVLNDRDERAVLGDRLLATPYNAPPSAPVVYIKPRGCFSVLGASVPVPADMPEVVLGATLGLLFGRTVTGPDTDPLGAVVGACLALDVSEPEVDYYRPAIQQRCRDGFLPLGGMTGFAAAMEQVAISTHIDGQIKHRWSLDRLMRPVQRLIAELAEFMTLGVGDLLLVGLPGDAPRASVGAHVEVRAAGLPTLRTVLAAEGA